MSIINNLHVEQNINMQIPPVISVTTKNLGVRVQCRLAAVPSFNVK